MRNIRGNRKWQGVQRNSSPDYGFSYTPEEKSEVLRVYEAPIDMLSHMTLAKINYPGTERWKKEHRLSINGITHFHALEKYLEDHPDITKVVFCYDNDLLAKRNYGQEAMQKHAQILMDRGYQCFKNIPKQKDFNEDLKALFEQAEEKNLEESLSKTNEIKEEQNEDALSPEEPELDEDEEEI